MCTCTPQGLSSVSAGLGSSTCMTELSSCSTASLLHECCRLSTGVPWRVMVFFPFFELLQHVNKDAHVHHLLHNATNEESDRRDVLAQPLSKFVGELQPSPRPRCVFMEYFQDPVVVVVVAIIVVGQLLEHGQVIPRTNGWRRRRRADGKNSSTTVFQGRGSIFRKPYGV